MEATRSTETSVHNEPTRRNIRKEGNLNLAVIPYFAFNSILANTEQLKLGT
jgi:hypothetical protein